MAAADHEGIVYVKDNSYGTVYFTIDSQGPIAISFFQDIEIRVVLGIVRPSCQLGRLLPQARLGQLNEALTFATETSGVWSTRDNNSVKPKENIVKDSVSYKQNADTFCDVGEEECDEPLDEAAEKPAPFLEGLALPSESICKKVGAIFPISHSKGNTLMSKPRNMPDNEKGLPTEQRRAQRQSRCRKKKVCGSQKLETNKTIRGSQKLKTNKIVCGSQKLETNNKVCDSQKLDTSQKESGSKRRAVKLSKLNSVNRSKTSKSRQTTELLDDSISNMKTNQPKKKDSLKWKLACQISCHYCLKMFDNQQAFYDHKKTQRSDVHKCYMCTKVFPFQAHLQAHISTCHRPDQLASNVKESASCICDVCGVEVKNLFALKKHLMFHTQEFFYNCCICSKQFVEPGTLNNHMATHKSGGMIKCKCCDQLFATRAALAKHKLASVEVKCHLCGQVFPNKTSRTQHYKINHQNDILKCSKCTSMFSSPEELTVHMKKHNLYKKKQCKICGKFFSRLELHKVTHKEKAEIDESELFVCDKCPKKFTNRSSFQRHLTTHSQDKPYQCPTCPRRFADCGALRKHLRRHISSMPYVCEVCGKKCKEPCNLKVHMRIHSDVKQFQCPLCPQAFNYKSSLEGHTRSRHSQNLGSSTALRQNPGMKQEHEKAESHQAYRTARLEPGPSQPSQSSSWKLELDANQMFPGAPSIEMKQFYENRTDQCIKSVYEESSINPGNLMGRHAFQAHSMHVSPDGLDIASKDTYVEALPSEDLSSTYTRAGIIINGQHHKESSVRATSMDVSTINVSSMNISLY